jgi:putative DNA primase/helicase
MVLGETMYATDLCRQLLEVFAVVVLLFTLYQMQTQMNHFMRDNIIQHCKGLDVLSTCAYPNELPTLALGKMPITIIVVGYMETNLFARRQFPAPKRGGKTQAVVGNTEQFGVQMYRHVDKASGLAHYNHSRGQMTTHEFPPNWKVFPLRAGTKKPIFDNWQNDATDDPAQIAVWELAYPDCNWALHTGASGLAVVDVDGVIGPDSLFALELDNEFLPNTLEQKTPHGRHLIFSGDVKPTVGGSKKDGTWNGQGIGHKLDTRGRNSYIVIAPSTVDGVPYEFSNNAPIAVLPNFISGAAGASRERVAANEMAVLDTELSQSRAKTLLANQIKSGNVAVSGGGGNDFTYITAATVLNLGLSEDKAFELLGPWNDACVPPWSSEELRTIIANASAYAQNDAGAWIVPLASTTVTPEALDQLGDVSVVREERNRFNWRDEDEFKNIPAPVWLIKDKLMRNSIAMMYGPSGHYKSFLGLVLAGEVALTGECAFYVAAEGIERMAAKDFPAWKLAYGVDKKVPFIMTDIMPKAFDNEKEFTEFANSIYAKAAGRKVGIIFLDTLNRAMSGLNDNDAKDASRMVDAAEFLKREFKCCVVLIHHTPKYDKETWRGSGVFYNDFDTVLAIHATKETKVVKITVAKQKTDEEYAKPFWYEGKRWGAGGLAFTPIEAREAKLMSPEIDTYSPPNISKALVRLEAFLPVTVSSKVLLEEIVPQLLGESQEERAGIIKRAQVGLRAAIKGGKLDGYHVVEGGGTKWSHPSPPEKKKKN